MASRAGTIMSFEILRGSDVAVPGESGLKLVAVDVQNNTASTVDGSSDTLDLATFGASIAGFLRNGKTITVLSVCVAQSAVVANTLYGGTAAMNSTTLQIVPKTDAAWTANAILPANSSVTQRPYRVIATIRES